MHLGGCREGWAREKAKGKVELRDRLKKENKQKTKSKQE